MFQLVYWCGDHSGSTYEAIGSEFRVSFTTDGSVAGYGFNISTEFIDLSK